jgi:hypothetical protein
VALPQSVTEIASTAFGAAFHLTSITVDPLNPAYTAQDGVLFTKSLDTLVTFPAAKSGKYTLPQGVENVAVRAFAACRGLTQITLPNTLTNISEGAFSECDNITTITIPKSVLWIDDSAFFTAAQLQSVFFAGNAPGITVRSFETRPKFYYLPGTTGWGEFTNTFPALNATVLLWNPQAQTADSEFGFRDHQFGFTITGTPEIPIVIEAATELDTPWTTLQSCTLTNGAIYFSDPDSINHPRRIYRLRSPL